jgi:hypothetical protein
MKEPSLRSHILPFAVESSASSQPFATPSKIELKFSWGGGSTHPLYGKATAWGNVRGWEGKLPIPYHFGLDFPL